MDRLVDTERLLPRMACPECGTAGSLQAVVRCDLAHGECLHAVRCQHCGIVFELSTETVSPRLFQPGLHAWLSALVCPTCNAVGAKVVFRCDVRSRSCFYRVRCAGGQHEYTIEAGTFSAKRGDDAS